MHEDPDSNSARKGFELLQLLRALFIVSQMKSMISAHVMWDAHMHIA